MQVARNSVAILGAASRWSFRQLGAGRGRFVGKQRQGDLEDYCMPNCLVVQLLYEIYDSVEEPDGFYGVPLAGDARSAVLKRLHHEEDWTQAFSYHGASFEISDARNGALPLVARSLRAFGFDTLAGTLLREVANDGGHMPLDLAWRTRQWDVPVEALVNSAAERPGASVYRTLRSVHHARDTSQAWSVARTALSEAFNTFGSIGVEDMAGIRQGLRTLLCLREVDLWFADLLPLVHLEDFAHDKWRAFRTLPANME
jgi:ataxia telangiectasia mutated family protein